jgi:hypothetical protein
MSYIRRTRDDATKLTYRHSKILSIIDDVDDYTKWDYLEGSTRRAYLGDVWVYKEPLWFFGAKQNKLEALVYHDMCEGRDVLMPVAECYLLPDGVLKMRRVKKIVDLMRQPDIDESEYVQAHGTLPEWVWDGDSGQCGLLEDELVIYDL